MAIRLTGVTYDNRMIDYTDALKKAEIQTNRMDTPGKMTFEGVEDSDRAAGRFSGDIHGRRNGGF